ncbi:3-deoxy-8-phosphooctulonate synthase [bacterium Unc6]|nr:3-deoxy-8-phosphooctulonate synthase [bacterium Unc6]
MKPIAKIGDIIIGQGMPLLLIAGPCVLEDEDTALDIAYKVSSIARKFHLPYIFKASFDKANRTNIKSYRGPGIKKGLKILSNVKKKAGVKILSDIHSPEQASAVADVLDVIQIPAFLCRQTDLICRSAKTGKPINIKKGQFLAPWDVKNIVEKTKQCGAKDIMITERGTTFGYNNFVVDMRGFSQVRDFGVPVIFDGTHSVQLPGGKGICSGGQRQFVSGLCKAAVAAGCDGIFLEVHPQPDKSPCDGPSMLPLNNLEMLLDKLVKIHNIVNEKY